MIILNGLKKINANKINRSPEDKRPLYVLVYDYLFSLIKDGYFKEGEKLPSENNLSNRLGISRGVLRQALLILEKDGVIKRVQGEGNFVTQKNTFLNRGLEYLKNLFDIGINDTYTHKNIEIYFESPNQKLQKDLNVSANEVLVSIHRNYIINKENICYAFSILPYQSFKNSRYSPEEKEELVKYVESNIYKNIANSKLKIKLTETGEFIEKKLSLEKKQNVLYLEEIGYNYEETPVFYTNMYVSSRQLTLFINRKN